MKKIVLLSFLLCAFFLNSIAQTKEELVGTWTVSKVVPPKEIAGESDAAGMKRVVDALMNATFQLDADGKCKASMVEEMAKENGMKAPATTWVYNEIDKSINVYEGTGKKKDLMMKIYVKKDGKKYLFVTDEFPVQMEVKKNKK